MYCVPTTYSTWHEQAAGTWVRGVVTPQSWYFFVERKGSRFLSTFLRCHGEEGGGLLMHLFTATFRTFDVAFFVFRKCQDDFKWLLAIFAVELIARHMDLRKTSEELDVYPTVYARETPVSRQAVIWEQASFRYPC
jgi:hypothetical protein